MTARVYGLSGKSVVVSTPDDSGEVVDYDLPAATSTTLGGVKVGSNLSVTADGTLSGREPYSLPVASATVLGGVKQGSNVTISADGTLSATNTVYTLPPATQSARGGVLQAPPIDDVETIPVTDIESAQTAVAAMGTTLSELIQGLRAAGIISS